ncbi:MAG: hypothetical protein OES47_04430 [Acidobacteriota bacterium]|nr:hypothetical protein [Acidobacteriota bacterium]
MRLRDVTAPLLLAGVVLILLLLALATRYPEAEIVARAEEWPVVGALANEFRARYLAVEAARTETDGGGDLAAGPEPARRWKWSGWSTPTSSASTQGCGRRAVLRFVNAEIPRAGCSCGSKGTFL